VTFKRCTGERANERVASRTLCRAGDSGREPRCALRVATPSREPRRTGPPRAAAQACFEQAVQSHREQPHCEQPRCTLRAAPGQQAGTPRRARGGAALHASQQGRAGGSGPRRAVSSEHAAGARKLRAQAEPGTPKAGCTSSRVRAAEPTTPGSRGRAAPGVHARASASSRPRHAANVKKMRAQGAVRRAGMGTPGIAR
jgi:hypothetical protein